MSAAQPPPGSPPAPHNAGQAVGQALASLNPQGVAQIFQQGGIKTGIAALAGLFAGAAVAGTGTGAPFAPVAAHLATAGTTWVIGALGVLGGAIAHWLGNQGRAKQTQAVASGQAPGFWATIVSKIF